MFYFIYVIYEVKRSQRHLLVHSTIFQNVNLFLGHFTQVVWKTSKKLGIAKARSPKSGKTIVVANYEPAGNWVGQYKENVLAPLE